ncbi:hypothetical protein CNR22_02615 [Sphingobacteriaceae bacterium]|nr:hypothetical protein CNR22_02615 [Sphingobacteriaceae bacterium]
MVLTPNITFLKVIEIPEANIVLRSDDIIHVDYNKDVTLDVELQIRMRAIFDKLADGKKKLFIFSAAEGFTLTKEARNNSDIMNGDSPIAAYAVVANNLAYKLIANFYLKVNKPKVPFKIFLTIDDAAKWLNTQR